MGHVRNIQGLFNKKGFDFERPDIDIYKFHPQLLAILASQGIFTGDPNSYFRFIMPFFTISVTIIGLVFQMICVYAGVIYENYSMACESFCYCVIVGSGFSVALSFLFSKKETLHLIDNINDDFVQVCSLGPRYREPFLAGQLLVWKLFMGWSGFVLFVANVFIFYPTVILLYQSLFATQDEYMQRPLVIPIWLPNDDPYRSPNYELFFFIEAAYIVFFVFSFGGYVYTLFHFLLHSYIMMDMIMIDFKALFEGLDDSVANLPKDDPNRVAVQMILNKRIGRIVTWHLSVFRALKTLSIIYRPSLVYHLMFSSVAICLMTYQIAETLDKGGFDFLFLCLTTGAVLQLWIPCYLGTLIRNKALTCFRWYTKPLVLDVVFDDERPYQSPMNSVTIGFAVGDACFNCGWHETSLGKMIRTDILLILMRSQMPIYIKYTGQPVVQLETFSAVISTSYSYFNMLRQSQKE